MTDHSHPVTGQPVGPPVDDKPAARPEPVTPQGRFGRIEKLAPAHAADLWQAAQDHDRIWTYMPSYGPFPDAAVFAAWVAQRAALEDDLRVMAASSDPLYFTLALLPDERPAGVASYMRIKPERGVIEIGSIWFGASLRRTVAATEVIYLLAAHVFDELGYRRLEWKCDALNAPSRRAAERFGFTFEGVFRQHMVVKGRNRDTAWYAITDREWPAIRAAFQVWLSPENRAGGQQVRRLGDLMAELRR